MVLFTVFPLFNIIRMNTSLPGVNLTLLVGSKTNQAVASPEPLEVIVLKLLTVAREGFTV